MTELAYPDLTSLITQPSLHHEGPLPGTFDPYLQPWATDVNDIQVEDHLLPNFMQYPGAALRTREGMPDYCSPYQTQPTSQASGGMPSSYGPYQTQTTLHTQQMTAYHSPYQTQFMSPTLGLTADYCSPYETQTLLQTQEQMVAYQGPYQTQLMPPTLRQMPDYHSTYLTQPMSRAPARMPDYHSPYQTDPPMTDPGINQLLSPTSLSPEDSTTLQGSRALQNGRKRKSPSTGSDEEYLQGGNNGIPPGKRNSRRSNPASLSSLASAQSLQHPNLGKQSRASGAQKVSKLGQLKAKLGDTMGSDNRAREKVLWENGTLFGWVNNEWSTLVHFRPIRIAKADLFTRARSVPRRDPGEIDPFGRSATWSTR